MVLAAALALLASAPTPEPLPRGVSLVGTAQAEIIRAERVSTVAQADAPRSVTPERDGIIVNFD